MSGEWSVGLVARMSAGKSAAQVAHALCRIVLETGAVPSFSLYRASADARGVVEVVDAGLSEFGGVPPRTRCGFTALSSPGLAWVVPS